MKEIEILVQLHSTIAEACSALKRVSKQMKRLEIKDTYYYDPLREDLQPNEQCSLSAAFRLRQYDNDYFLTYKVDHFSADGRWEYSDEYETRILDLQAIEHIISCLGLKELVKVNVQKYVFLNDKYEIVVEEVENLGSFLEVEAKALDDDKEPNSIKQEIEKFISELGLSVSRNFDGGKPELLLRKERGLRL